MSSILDRIVARKREEVAAAKRAKPLEVLVREAAAATEQAPCRDFLGALQARIKEGASAVIAEMKKASPSKGMLREPFVAAALAQGYAEHGAACLSVLTDGDFFQGHAEHLQHAKQSCRLPVLRKDFLVDVYQVYESRAMGADCILLVAGLLSDAQMAEMERIAHSLQMAVLVEVHDLEELLRALKLDSPLLGVNNRDLRTFEVNLETTLKLLPRVPADRLLVAESGIRDRSDVRRMRAAGVNAFLVGESLMRAEDPGAQLASLFFS